MSSLFHSISNLFTPNGLTEYSRRYPSCFFLRLPLLVYLDYIFPCLALEDIMSLRRVNKAFYLITHEPSIWRRFLERMNHHPIVYLRPNFDYTSSNAYYEIEQIVSRTISLDDNWRDSKPKVITRLLFETHYEVLDMAILPGGKYLCASIKDRGSYRYYIALYILDHPSGPHAIARVPTHTKAFRLQAKYLKINGEYGVAVSCIRRRYATGKPLDDPDNPILHNLPDLSQLSGEHKIDVPFPYFSEVLVFFTPLSVLEHLCDPSIEWGSEEHRRRLEQQSLPPLRLANNYEVSENDVQHVAMFDNDGEAWMAVVTKQHYIAFFHCGHSDVIVLKCTEHPEFALQPIRAILPLPKQKQILVVRQYMTIRFEEWVVELYPFPTHHVEMSPTHFVVVRQAPANSLTKVTISDPQIPFDSPTFPKLRPNPLPPVSIYFQHNRPHGLLHFCLWPMYEQMLDGSTKCIPRYIVDPTPPLDGPTPEFEAMQAEAIKHYAVQTCHISDPQVANVLPGGYRAIYYTTSYDDLKASPSMIKLRRYLSPEIQKVTYPARPDDNSASFLRKPRPLHPNGLYGTIEIPIEDSSAFGKGINAITWDESIGRICIAVEGELGVRILDMARSVEPDKRFVGWKETMSREIAEQDCWNSKNCIHSGSIPGWYEHWLG